MHSVVINLSSGITEGMFKLRVVNDGMALQLLVDWPKYIRDITKLHVKWLRPGYTDSISSYHPPCVSFQNDLKEIRSHALQKFQSSCLFKLPSAVRADLSRQHNLVLTPHETIVVYVYMREVSNEYAERQNYKAFEMFDLKFWKRLSPFRHKIRSQ